MRQQMHPPMPTFTAWQSRLANEELLHRTADLLGGDWTPVDGVTWGELTCTLPDGTPGTYYRLRGIETEPAGEDLDATIETVRDLWTSWGLEPHDRGIGEARGLSVTNPDDHAMFVFLTGPGGGALYGQSGCATTTGRPADEPLVPTPVATPGPGPSSTASAS
ncbi:hypothetical protein [Cellulomonas hominis]